MVMFSDCFSIIFSKAYLKLKMRYTVILFFTIFLYIKADNVGEEIERINKECIKRVDIDPEIVTNALEGNFPENTTKYKQFLTCGYKKQGYQNENGEIQIENIKKNLKKLIPSIAPEVLNSIDECGEFKGPDHGENAWNTMQCLLRKLKINFRNRGE